jgi:hypothetical protein
MIKTDATAAQVLVPLQAFLKQNFISKSSFYRRLPEMPPIVKFGRAVYVPLDTARAWLAARTVPATSLGGRA